MTWSYEIQGVNHYFWSCHKEWIWILLLLHAYYSSKQLCIHIHVPVCINKEKNIWITKSMLKCSVFRYKSYEGFFYMYMNVFLGTDIF